MTQFEAISCNISIASCIISGIAVIFAALAAFYTYKNLKEIQNQFFEQNRGNLVFFIEKTRTSQFHSLIIKNFGISPAKLISIEVMPELDWNETKFGITEEANISNCKNVLLAPNKFIESKFYFDGYPENEFIVKLTYETSGKVISETSVVNISYLDHVVTEEKTISDEFSALKEINYSIQDLSNKFI